MTEQNKEPIAVQLLHGDVHVHGNADRQSAVFEFTTASDPVRIAIRIEDVARLIIGAAHFLSPELPMPGQAEAINAMPATGWSIVAAGPDHLAFSFQMMEGACLSFLLPRSVGPLQLEALQAALGMLTGEPRNRQSDN